MTRRQVILLAALTAATAIYLALLLLGPAEALVRTPEYQLPVLRHGLWSRAPGGALVLAVGLLPLLLLLRSAGELTISRAGRARLYAVLFLAGAACQLGPAAVHRYGLMEMPLRVFLPDHTSYFTDAVKIEHLPTWLMMFPENVATFGTHTRTHPPGAVLLFYFPVRLMRAAPDLAGWIAGLVPRADVAGSTFKIGPPEIAAGIVSAFFLFLVAAAAVPLTFAFARVFLDDRRALAATALFASMPAFAQKTPMLDHLLGFITLLCAWLCLSALRERQMARVAAAGALTGAGLWLGTSALAAIPLCLLLVAAGIHRYRREGATNRAHAGLWLSLAAVFIGATGLVLAGLGAMMGLNYLDVYRAITEAGWQFNNETSGRLHTWMWVAWDPYEILIFAGLPAGALAAAALGRQIRLAADRRWDQLQPWLLAVGLFLAALVLSGRVVYEASRLAWFSFPLIATAASSVAPDPETRAGQVAITVMVGLTALSALGFRLLF